MFLVYIQNRNRLPYDGQGIVNKGTEYDTEHGLKEKKGVAPGTMLILMSLRTPAPGSA